LDDGGPASNAGGGATIDQMIHYMLPAAARVPLARRLVADQNYFVIHAPRQSGKTTAMIDLAQELTALGEMGAFQS
jgi:hypothetical protein